MIRFRILGKRVSMSEDQWEQLKQRFDEKNVMFVTESHHPAYVDQRWEIMISCPWCKKYNWERCRDCVWDKFSSLHGDRTGCICALQIFLKEKYGIESYHSKLGSVIGLGTDRITWTRGVDEEARQILRCIQKEFRAIEIKRTKKTIKVTINKARCKKCGDIIESKSRHDFQQCKCGAIFVDGGKDYCRRGGNPEDLEELSE